MNLENTPKVGQRIYLPNEFKLTVWSRVRPYFNELLRRQIQSTEDFQKWILDYRELVSIIQAEFEERHQEQISKNENQQAAELYEYAVQELAPKIILFEKRLNEKLLNCKFSSDDEGEIFFSNLRSLNEISCTKARK